MIRRLMLGAALVVALAAPVSGQLFGGIVYDPTNYANAVLRYGQLQQQLAELIATYQQIRTQYLLLRQQAQRLPFDLNARYRSLPTPWLVFDADSTHGTTNGWILTANTGHEAVLLYRRATQALRTYGGALEPLPAEERARAQSRYDRLQLTDASLTHALEALGFLRGHQMSVEQAVRNLEDDTYADGDDLHTQVSVLNKINATAVTSARLAKDANNVLVSLLEQQVLDATDRRDAAAQGINAHIAFLNEAGPLLARTTAHTTAALTAFRIP